MFLYSILNCQFTRLYRHLKRGNKKRESYLYFSGKFISVINQTISFISVFKGTGVKISSDSPFKKWHVSN